MVNELKKETSLYLSQHQNNPVDWFPWGEKAFEIAKKDEKPIFLSIGYSSCHWCHVMAHESFEDKEVASLLNKYFICIKVDKEERPDIDHIYQRSHFIFSKRPGGWPLSVFLTPQQEPFYIATYLPKISKFNLPGMMQLLPRIAELYKSEKDMIQKQTIQIKNLLGELKPKKEKTNLIDINFINLISQQLNNNLDQENGGFGTAPKFPNEQSLNFLLRSIDIRINERIIESLKKIVNSGLFDHVEGGFFRYCVDEKWTIPHYEKMLYNSAQMIEVLTIAFIKTKEKNFENTINLTIDWLKKRMTDSKGYFFSSMDADSKNTQDVLEEGAYYNYSQNEFENEFTQDELVQLREFFYLEGMPNFEEKKWHLNKRDDNYNKVKFDQFLERLNKQRKNKALPVTDKKMIVSWNALMIKSLLFSGRVMKKKSWINIGQKALDFICQNMFSNEKLNTIYDENSKLSGYLDDYAFLLDALIESMQANFRGIDYDFSLKLSNKIVKNFQSDEGAFFFTDHNHETLFDREILSEDDATPSGNGIACLALQKFSQINQSSKMDEYALKVMQHLNNNIVSNPISHPSMLSAFNYFFSKKTVIFIYGDDININNWYEKLPQEVYLKSIVIFLNTEEKFKRIFKTGNIQEKNVAYICQNYTCYPVCKNIDELLSII